MTDDRYPILDRIRQALKTAHLPSARATLPPAPSGATMDPDAMFEELVRELGAVGVNVYQPATAAGAIKTIVELIGVKAKEYGQTSKIEILAWDDGELPVDGLGQALQAAGFVCLDARLPADAEGRRARLAELGRATVGLTGARAGLADSGTLALVSGPARSRLASLLPPVHIAILSRRALYPTLADFVAAEPDLVREASNLVLITGPSRTADIEQTLTLGVHGPREVHVVLVD